MLCGKKLSYRLISQAAIPVLASVLAPVYNAHALSKAEPRFQQPADHKKAWKKLQPVCSINGNALEYRKGLDWHMVENVVSSPQEVVAVACMDKNALVLTDKEMTHIRILERPIIAETMDGRSAFIESIQNTFRVEKIMERGFVSWTYSENEAYFLTKDRMITVRPYAADENPRTFILPEQGEVKQLAYSRGQLLILLKGRILLVASPQSGNYIPYEVPGSDEKISLFFRSGKAMVGEKGKKEFEIKGSEAD